MGQYTIDDVREQLNGTLDIKDDIMSAINDMGGSVTSETTFDKYPEAIRNIVAPPQPFYVPNDVKFGYSQYVARYPDNFDFSRITDGSYLFASNYNLLEIPSTIWLDTMIDTSNMFEQCIALDFSQYSSLTIGSTRNDYMFSACKGELPKLILTGIPSNLLGNCKFNKINDIEYAGRWDLNWYTIVDIFGGSWMGNITSFNIINQLGIPAANNFRFVLNRGTKFADKESIKSVFRAAIACGDVHSYKQSELSIMFDDPYGIVDEDGSIRSLIAQCVNNGWDVLNLTVKDSPSVSISQKNITFKRSEGQNLPIQITGSDSSYIPYPWEINVVFDDPTVDYRTQLNEYIDLSSYGEQYGDFEIELRYQRDAKASYTATIPISTADGADKITIRYEYISDAFDDVMKYAWYVKDLQGGANRVMYFNSYWSGDGYSGEYADAFGTRTTAYFYPDGQFYYLATGGVSEHFSAVADTTNNVYPWKFVSQSGRFEIIPCYYAPGTVDIPDGNWNITDSGVTSLVFNNKAWNATTIYGESSGDLNIPGTIWFSMPYTLNGGNETLPALLTKLNNVDTIYCVGGTVATK